MGKYRGTKTVEVEVDLSDVLENLDDDMILDEAKQRKLIVEADIGATPYVKDYVALAHEELMAGRAASALAFLDRALFPTGAEKSPDGQLVFKVRT